MCFVHPLEFLVKTKYRFTSNYSLSNGKSDFESEKWPDQIDDSLNFGRKKNAESKNVER